MADSLKITLAKIAFVICGIWLVLWLAKKISGTAFIVCLACTYIGYLAVKEYLEHRGFCAKLAYATAGRNERANQHLLATSIEQTKQARWKFYLKLLGAIVCFIKLLPILIHLFQH